MGFSKIPGPVSAGPLIDRPKPSSPLTGLAPPGAVGMKGGGQCRTTPRLRGWPRAITWREFEEIVERPAGENEDAEIRTETILDDDVTICREGGQLRLGTFTARLRVVTSDTWVASGTKTGELLSHEQGHYDLQGLFARALMGRLSRVWASDNEELGRLVDAEFKASQKEAQAMSNLYDDETQHGLDVQKQGQWKAAIQKAITTGDPFQVP